MTTNNRFNAVEVFFGRTRQIFDETRLDATSGNLFRASLLPSFNVYFEVIGRVWRRDPDTGALDTETPWTIVNTADGTPGYYLAPSGSPFEIELDVTPFDEVAIRGYNAALSSVTVLVTGSVTDTPAPGVSAVPNAAPPVSGGGGSATAVKVFVTTGAPIDNGDTIDYQFDIDVVEDDSEEAAAAVFGVQLEIFDFNDGGFFDVSEFTMVDTEGSTSVSCGTGCTSTQFLVTTNAAGQYRGAIRLQKSSGRNVTVNARTVVFVSTDPAFEPAPTNFRDTFVNLDSAEFVITNNAELEAELAGSGYAHGAYGVYNDGTTRRALRWFAFDEVSGAGRIVPHEVWTQGTLTYIGGYDGNEVATPPGFTTQGLAVNYAGTHLDFDSSGAAGTRALNLAIPTGTYSQIYFAQFQQIPSMTNDEGVGTLLREGAYLNTCGRLDDGLGAQLQTENPSATGSFIPAGTRVTNRENDAAFAYVEGWLYDAAGNSGRMFYDQTLQSESVGGLDSVAAGQIRVGIADPQGQAQVLSKFFGVWGIV